MLRPAVLLLSLLLTACGQSGDLYLPATPAASVPPAVTAPAPETPPAEAPAPTADFPESDRQK